MRITQGAFSFLPDFTDAEIEEQVRYCLDNNWAVLIEHTDDPHPRNVYWTLWELPMFDTRDTAAVMQSLAACRAAFPDEYIRLSAYDRRLGRQTIALQFIVQRPKAEPGFRLERTEWRDRSQRYAIRSYAVDKPAGSRYSSEQERA